MAKRSESKKEMTNREIIESKSSRVEHAYIKFPGERLIDVTKEGSSQEGEVIFDAGKIKKEMKVRGKNTYRSLHEHPYDSGDPYDYHALPSPDDITRFENHREEKVMNIAQRDKNTGELMGYTMIFKGDKKIPQEEDNKREYSTHDKVMLRLMREKDKKNMSNSQFLRLVKYSESVALEGTAEEAKENLNEFLDSLGQGVRFHPARGYYFNKQTGNYEKKEHNLEGAVASILIGSILLFLFLKVPLSGSVISNVASSSNLGLWFGISILFVLAFGVGAYFLLKPYRKK